MKKTLVVLLCLTVLQMAMTATGFARKTGYAPGKGKNCVYSAR